MTSTPTNLKLNVCVSWYVNAEGPPVPSRNPGDRNGLTESLPQARQRAGRTFPKVEMLAFRPRSWSAENREGAGRGRGEMQKNMTQKQNCFLIKNVSKFSARACHQLFKQHGLF